MPENLYSVLQCPVASGGFQADRMAEALGHLPPSPIVKSATGYNPKPDLILSPKYNMNSQQCPSV
jgi:hypothetical protein